MAIQLVDNNQRNVSKKINLKQQKYKIYNFEK